MLILMSCSKQSFCLVFKKKNTLLNYAVTYLASMNLRQNKYIVQLIGFVGIQVLAAVLTY